MPRVILPNNLDLVGLIHHPEYHKVELIRHNKDIHLLPQEYPNKILQHFILLVWKMRRLINKHLLDLHKELPDFNLRKVFPDFSLHKALPDFSLHKGFHRDLQDFHLLHYLLK
jgi:hypothetical protein